MNKNLPIIKRITSLIMATVSPENIILFGSYGRDDNTPASDMDILIMHCVRWIDKKIGRTLAKNDIPKLVL